MKPSLKRWVRSALPRTTGAHRILSGYATGARIYTSWHDYPGAILGTTERPLLRWFDANVKPGETWLDVGAHYGYTAIALARLTGPSGRVYAFEPVVATAGCLARTRELNRLDQLTVVPLALDERPGPHRLRLPTTRGMADSTLAGGHPEETIFATSLDALWPSLGGPQAPIHGVKIDVQAMELQVLTGMREALARWTPKLVVEFHRGVDHAAILKLLSCCGYSTAAAPIDARCPEGGFADDHSYSFSAKAPECEYSFTP